MPAKISALFAVLKLQKTHQREVSRLLFILCEAAIDLDPLVNTKNELIDHQSDFWRQVEEAQKLQSCIVTTVIHCD